MLSPISHAEFLTALLACTPRSGWGKRLAVAFSGGPDSTCLLYLLHTVLKDGRHCDPSLPTSVHALSIDHALQAASSEMADHCARFARDRGIPLVRFSVPWGKPPFPRRPTKTAFEAIARDARQRLFLDWMVRENVSTLATGHHADDNVETLVLGHLRSSNSMQTIEPCRRWGMGDAVDTLGFAGLYGMNSWVIRPLLTFSKSRILATCDEHGLPYVVDETNFQSSLTPRNAIRDILKNVGSTRIAALTGKDASENSSLEPRLFRATPVVRDDDDNSFSRSRIVKGITRLLDSKDIPMRINQDQNVSSTLHALAHSLTLHKASLNVEALEHLELHRYSSPGSTFLLLSGSRRPDRNLCRAIVYRILRFVSPFPWGSVASQAHRRTEAVDELISMIWDCPPPTHAVTKGSLVQWTPVIVRANGKIKLGITKALISQPGDRSGWLASRQPAYTVPGLDKASDSVLDVTRIVVDALRDGKDDHVEVLYDCRFLVRVFLEALPDDCRANLLAGEDSLRITPRAPYWLPHLIWRQYNRSDAALPQTSDSGPPRTLWQSTPIREL